MVPVHSQVLSSDTLAQAVEFEAERFKQLEPPIMRILLFGAYEARAEKSSVIECRHLLLGALRERGRTKDGEVALRVRRHANTDAASVNFPVSVSESVAELIKSADSAQEIIERFDKISLE